MHKRSRRVSLTFHRTNAVCILVRSQLKAHRPSRRIYNIIANTIEINDVLQPKIEPAPSPRIGNAFAMHKSNFAIARGDDGDENLLSSVKH